MAFHFEVRFDMIKHYYGEQTDKDKGYWNKRNAELESWTERRTELDVWCLNWMSDQNWTERRTELRAGAALRDVAQHTSAVWR